MTLSAGMTKPISHVYKFTRAWREFRELTQEQVANMLGISNNVLSEKERGLRKFKPEEIEKLAVLYKCEPWMLMAAAPDDPKLEVLQRAVSLAEKLTPQQTKAWLDVGESMANVQK